MTDAWHPGDPIAPGRLCLPNDEARAAYARACRVAIAAAHVAGGRSRTERRARLASVPVGLRAEVRRAVEQRFSESRRVA